MKIRRIKKAEGIVEPRMIEMLLFLITVSVIIYVVVRIVTTGDIDKSVCQQSIENRAALTTILPSFTKEFVPLKCKTIKYCVTGGGGTCEDAYGKDLKGVKQIKVDSTTQIEKFLADEMLSCWTMTGKGKLSVFSQYWASNVGFGPIYPTCIVCDRVAFDVKTLTKISLKDIDLVRYMASHKIPNGDVSYLTFFGVENGKIGIQDNNSLNSLTDALQKLKDELNKADSTKSEAASVDETLTALKEDNQKPESSQLTSSPQVGILFMQITAPGHGSSLVKIGGALGVGTAASFMTAPTLTGRLFIGLGNLIKNNPFAAFITAAIALPTQQGLVAWNQQIAAGYCGDVSTGGEARSGCSVVRLVDYNEQGIKSVCQALESY